MDGSGNVYVADDGNNAVKEMLAAGGIPPCVNTLGSGFNGPFGVAVDGSGNVFVADTDNNAVKEMVAVWHHPGLARHQDAGQRLQTRPMAWRWTAAGTSTSPIRQQWGEGDAGGRRQHPGLSHHQRPGQRL